MHPSLRHLMGAPALSTAALALALFVPGARAASLAPLQDGNTLEESELSRLERQRQDVEKEAEKRKRGKGGLILPHARRAPAGGAPPKAAPVTGGAPAAPAATDDTDATTEAVVTPDTLIASLADRERIAASEARGYAEELLAFGDDGIAAARRGLASEHQAVLLTCARAVLLTQDTAGTGILRGRLSRELPADAIAPLLRAIDELAPATMSKSDLVALLDHPQSTLRSAVERLLSERLTGEDLPLLARALSAERTDTRVRALELVGQQSGEGALDLLFARLDDSRPQVAQRAAEILASRPDETVEARLLQLAFETKALFRQQCYALVALVEREDRRGETIVGEDRVEVLVQNLASVSPFARGAAAVTLAGIGYRSESSESNEWYRLRVPHELVSTVVADEWHKDFSALQTPALRRLERLSGRTFGNDGPAWRSWWLDTATNFTPRRAVLASGPEAAQQMHVVWELSTGRRVELAATRANVALSANVLWLDEADALRLAAQFEASGVLSAERIPAAERPDTAETLTIAVADGRKAFSFPLGLRPQWLVESTLLIEELATVNAWQILADPSIPGSRRGLFNAESAWWREMRAMEGERGRILRSRREKELALAALVTMESATRGDVLDRLLDVCTLPGVLDPEDAGALLTILDTEPYHTPRTERIVGLLLVAGVTGADGSIDPTFGRELFDRLYTRFRGGALDSLARVTKSMGLEFARELSIDARAISRGLAADVLAVSEEMDDTKRMLRLMSEGEVDQVQESALIAVGVHGRQDLRGIVLERAERAPDRVRQAAIEALGELGGPGALEAMMLCFADGSLSLQRSALRALGKLDAPQAADTVVQMIGRGPSSPLFETAREVATSMGPIMRLPLVELALEERSPGRDEAAFVLSELGAAEAVPALLRILTEGGEGADRAADELALLSCVDLRAREDRDTAWRAWWDGLTERDALAWLREAQLRNGLPVAPPGSLESGGTRDGALALVATVEAPAGVVSERARRELARLLDMDVPPRPQGLDTTNWRASIVGAIDQRFGN